MTHPHADHYQILDLNQIQKPTTINIFPENMTEAINIFDGIGLNPGDTIEINDRITVTAFYMYTFPVESFPASHPAEANWTSYIIDIEGFTFFHAGDSKNIPEYEHLEGLINVAMLPLGPGCQTMTDMEVVEVINTIDPQYVVPIHWEPPRNEEWFNTYGILIGATYININHWESYRF